MSKSAKVERKKSSVDSPALNTRSRRRVTIASSNSTNGKFWNSNMQTPKRSQADRQHDVGIVRIVDTPTPLQAQQQMTKVQKTSPAEKQLEFRKSHGTSSERTRNGTPYVKPRPRSVTETKSSKASLSGTAKQLELPLHSESKSTSSNKSNAYLTMRSENAAKVFDSDSSDEEDMEKWKRPKKPKELLDETFVASSEEEKKEMPILKINNLKIMKLSDTAASDNCIILERKKSVEPKEKLNVSKTSPLNQTDSTQPDLSVLEPKTAEKLGPKRSASIHSDATQSDVESKSSVTVDIPIPSNSTIELKTANSSIVSQQPITPSAASSFSVLQTSSCSSIGLQTPMNSSMDLQTANSASALKATVSPPSDSIGLETANSSNGSQIPIVSVSDSLETPDSGTQPNEQNLLDLNFAQMENRLANMVELIGRMEQRQNEMTARLIQLHIDQRDLHRQQNGRLVDALEMIVDAIAERESRFNTRLQRFVDARLNAQSAIPPPDSTTMLRDALRPLVGTLRAELERHLADVVSATLADAMSDIVATMTALMRDRSSPPPSSIGTQSRPSPIENCGVDAESGKPSNWATTPLSAKTAVVSAATPPPKAANSKLPKKVTDSPLSMQEKIQKIYATSSSLMRSYSPLLGKTTTGPMLNGKPKAPCTLAQPTTSAAAAAADRLSSLYFAAESATASQAK